jgi:ATP-binding cassette subfamily F protein 3
VLAGELPALAGEILRHRDLRAGYLAQHQLEQLDPAASPFQHLRRLEPAIEEQSARDFLGGFDFRGERVYEPVEVFSGGERARLALALVVRSRPNLLLLDEPTNHLDLDLRAALELALQDYAGALVLVSHDRHLLAVTCDELWRVADGAVRPFDGDLDDYAAWLAARERSWLAGAAAAPGEPRPATARDRRRAAAEQRAREKPLRDTLARAESAMAGAQRRLAEIEGRLSETGLYQGANQEELTGLLKEQAALRRDLAATEDVWLAAVTALEALQAGVDPG